MNYLNECRDNYCYGFSTIRNHKRNINASGKGDPNSLRFKSNSKDRPKWMGKKY